MISLLGDFLAFVLLSPNYLIAAIPRPEDWREGTGLLEFVLVAVGIFILLVPICLVRGWKKGRRFVDSLEEAWRFAIGGAVGLVALVVAVVFLVGIPFGILNFIGLMAAGRQFYWPIVVPGLALLYGFFGILIWREISHRRSKK